MKSNATKHVAKNLKQKNKPFKGAKRSQAKKQNYLVRCREEERKRKGYPKKEDPERNRLDEKAKEEKAAYGGKAEAEPKEEAN